MQAMATKNYQTNIDSTKVHKCLFLLAILQDLTEPIKLEGVRMFGSRKRRAGGLYDNVLGTLPSWLGARSAADRS